MEEILASIRRIIADDQAATTQPKEEQHAEPPSVGAAAPNEDLPDAAVHAEAPPNSTSEPMRPRQETTETAESALREAVAKPEIRRVVGPEDFAALAREMRPPRPRPAPSRESPDPLVSPVTDAAVSASFNSLAASRFLQSEEQIADMVRDMLRPMLKAWLDDNLPILVERLVRAEIERVARGGR